eukprot:3621812-Pyramimonas_sp.AAC.1
MQGRALAGCKMLGCETVRAHKAIDDHDISPQEHVLRVGDDFADHAAKLGAVSHPSGASSTLADIDASVSL